jgi:hypothetical protein
MNLSRNQWSRLLVVCLMMLFLAGTMASQARRPSTTAAIAFRDSADVPPPNWHGPVFKLSHNYPKTRPTCEAPWLKRQVSFNSPNPSWSDWAGYVQDIVDYVKQGQDKNLTDGWNLNVSGQTRWFHIPWMAYDGERGREFVHGLTNELSTAQTTFKGPNGQPVGRGTGKATLRDKPTANGVDPLYETWSVGMYNPCGAYPIGQVFPPSGEPATYTKDGKNFARGLPFPEGTVVIKLLNTTANGNDVAYMKGSTNWKANAHKQLSPTEYSTCEREVRDVHLVQIDLAVVDERSPTRWVYATLAYDGRMPGPTVWDRLVPLGVQWGNDPQSFPAVPQSQSQPLRETVLNTINIPEHYGCNKRLAGAVDQPNSSCVSCHMGAYAAPPPYLNRQAQTVPAIFNFCGLCTEYNEGNAQYFSDYKYPATFPNNQFTSAIPLDSSLQLAVAFAQFAIYKNPQAIPVGCPDRHNASNAGSR